MTSFTERRSIHFLVSYLLSFITIFLGFFNSLSITKTKSLFYFTEKENVYFKRRFHDDVREVVKWIYGEKYC